MKIYLRDVDADHIVFQVDADDGRHAIGALSRKLVAGVDQEQLVQLTLESVQSALNGIERRRRGEPEIGDMARPKQARGAIPYACIGMIDEDRRVVRFEGSPAEVAWSDLEYEGDEGRAIA